MWAELGVGWRGKQGSGASRCRVGEVKKAHADVFNVLLQVCGGLRAGGELILYGGGNRGGVDEVEKAHADVFNVLLQVRGGVGSAVEGGRGASAWNKWLRERLLK